MGRQLPDAMWENDGMPAAAADQIHLRRCRLSHFSETNPMSSTLHLGLPVLAPSSIGMDVDKDSITTVIA